MVKKILPTDNDTANGVRKNNSRKRKATFSSLVTLCHMLTHGKKMSEPICCRACVNRHSVSINLEISK